MIRKWIKKIVNEILKEELVFEYDDSIEEATAEIVAKRVNIDMNDVYEYLGVSIEDIAHEIDMDDLASHIDASDVAWSVDAEEVGRNIDLQDLATHVHQELYENLDINYNELTELIDQNELAAEVAERIDMDDLAEHIDEDDLADCIDYKLLAKAVVEHQKKEEEE